MTLTSEAPFTRLTRVVPDDVAQARALLAPPPTTVPATAGPRRRVERAVLRRALARIDEIDVHEQVGGALPRPVAVPATRHRVVVRDGRAWSAVARDGSAGLGEAWFRGWWHTDDLVGMLRVLIRNMAHVDRARARLDAATAPVVQPLRRLRRPDAARDRRNVRAHYDLSNEFFAAFLDETMTYSSAVFTDPSMPLADASREKLDRLCRKVGMQPDHRVLEIGTGWGSFALHAAGMRGAHVTTTTVSAAQAALARERFRAAGLDDRISLLELDYRDLQGTFDRLVSIEMIEAVDWRDVPAYFSHCGRLLAPDGLFGMQAIVIADQRYERARHTDDFIKQWVFPGGCLPSVTSLVEAASSASELRVVDLEDLGAHYAETLHRWRDRLHEIWDELPTLGVGPELARLWDFYLAYCEAAFRERHVSVVQLVLANPAWRPDGLTLRPS